MHHEHHALRRASERFHSSRHRLIEIKDEIESGVSWHVHTQGDGREVHVVFVSHREVPVVWNPETCEVVTVLPEAALKDPKYAKELKGYRQSVI
jgi:hypothetical protein